MSRDGTRWSGVGGLNSCAEGALPLTVEEFQRFFEGFFEQMPYGLAVTNLEGDILRANASLQSMLGYGSDELCGTHFSEITHPNDLEQNLELYHRLLAGEIKYYRLEKRYIHRDGHLVAGQLTVTCVSDDRGEPQYLIAIIENIDDRKRHESRVHHLQHRDSLTELPNRTGLMRLLRETIHRAARVGEWVLLILLDLDRFKAINESLGHERGDQLLKAVSNRLVEAKPDGGELARLGGDEFVLVLSGIEGRVDAEPSAVLALQRFIDVLSRPCFVGRKEVFLSASMGVAIYPQDASSPEDLVRNAESAMYHAKAERRRSFAFFSSHMNESAEERLTLESELRGALRDGGLDLHFQPQFDLSSSKVIGAEALVRWKHTQRGLVLPQRFVPMAEESGIVVDIDQWVVRRGLKTLRQWLDDGLPPIRLALNLSAITFREADPVSLLGKSIDEFGVDPELIEVEITESSMMERSEQSVEVVRALKKQGLSVALDDFGTGYSSLSYLHRFPIDRIKIDQSFVQRLDSSDEDAMIVGAIIKLGHGLGLEVIAEGVEERTQLSFLEEQGCDMAQGFLLGRPISEEDFRAHFLV